ncbi:MAG: hypothetical protein GF350_03165, partial [Chitinivibrionales bacterium]|nr:hypothetical protein [Chitinivibrionales bacterium]
MSRFSAVCFLILACFFPVLSANPGNDTLQILAGAETHAMLFPCDCPGNPGGGLANRAAFLSELVDYGDRLLLDAGGFSGGGIYDSYSEGRAIDSARTRAAIQAMGYMKYDAVAVGDEELQFGGKWLVETAGKYSLPLVSANCFINESTYLAQPYVFIEKKDKIFGITAVTTREKLFDIDSSIIVADPRESLEKIRDELKRKSDFQIILSHVGEENVAWLVSSLPSCDLIVNGHRKTGTAAVTVRQGIPVMNFNFQGKALSYLSAAIKGDSLILSEKGWHEILPGMPEDSVVHAMLELPSEIKNTQHSSRYDLYIMAHCPYGTAALKELLAFTNKFSGIDFHLWFIGSVRPDTVLSSLHGKDEIREEKTWLAVRALYPGQWRSYIERRTEFKQSNEELFESMGFDSRAIARWIEKQGERKLAMHYHR